MSWYYYKLEIYGGGLDKWFMFERPNEESYEILRDAYHVDSQFEEVPHIEKRELLSDYPQILDVVIQMLTIARAGGMTEERFYEIGREILAAYGNLRGDSFYALRDGLIQILTSDDYSFEEKKPRGLDSFFGRN